MINEHMHLIAPISPEFRVFIERQEKEVSLLKQAPDALAESFWIKKCCYHQYENDMGRLLLNREDKRLENANTRNKWLAVFLVTYFFRLQKPNLSITRSYVGFSFGMNLDRILPRKNCSKSRPNN